MTEIEQKLKEKCEVEGPIPMSSEPGSSMYLVGFSPYVVFRVTDRSLDLIDEVKQLAVESAMRVLDWDGDLNERMCFGSAGFNTPIGDLQKFLMRVIGG